MDDFFAPFPHQNPDGYFSLVAEEAVRAENLDSAVVVPLAGEVKFDAAVVAEDNF
jgi:hypothetical protein